MTALDIANESFEYKLQEIIKI